LLSSSASTSLDIEELIEDFSNYSEKKKAKRIKADKVKEEEEKKKKSIKNLSKNIENKTLVNDNKMDKSIIINNNDDAIKNKDDYINMMKNNQRMSL